ncbi:MAG: hypothetical protein R3D63_13640 [Paracoccaceae bacterium]
MGDGLRRDAWRRDAVINEKLVDYPSDLEIRRNLSVAYERLGDATRDAATWIWRWRPLTSR